MKRSFLLQSLKLTCLSSFFFVACKKTEFSSSPTVQQATGSATYTVAATGSFGSCSYVFSDASLKGWTKVFEDDFNNGLSNWNIWTGGAYNYELQHYQAGNLKTTDGVLSIEAKRENVTGRVTPYETATKDFSFTSGRIESKTHYSANNAAPKVRMIARIKIPAGYGMWPAFWSYGDPWPTQGEIDILEARGNEPFVYHTAYWYGRRSGVNTARNTEATVQSSVSLTECWHVYEMIWEKNTLTFLFDGQVVDTKTGGEIPNFFRKSQRITLNLAIGGLFFGPTPLSPSAVETGTMLVDWVKVFTAK